MEPHLKHAPVMYDIEHSHGFYHNERKLVYFAHFVLASVACSIGSLVGDSVEELVPFLGS